MALVPATGALELTISASAAPPRNPARHRAAVSGAGWASNRSV